MRGEKKRGRAGNEKSKAKASKKEEKKKLT